MGTASVVENPGGKMRAVITGVAGFIGSHLAEALIAGGWSVTGIDAFTPYYAPADKEANLAGLVHEPGFDLVRADLVSMDLRRVLAGRPAVIHLAAQPGVRQSFGDGFDRYLRDNVLATQRVFEASLEAGCQRVVYASSSSVYGDAPQFPSEETLAARPRSPYGVTKRTCEYLAGVYRDLGLETVGLRYFTVYGPRQRPDMAIRRLCDAVHGGPGYRLFGDGTASRDFTYVLDAVDATIRAMVAPNLSTVLNVGGGEEATMAHVIALIEGLTGDRLPIEMTAAQPGDVSRTAAETSRARRQLAWVPAVGLTEGLRAELDWVGTRVDSRTEVGALAACNGWVR
jgi:UDP-glucuronate 4-epimerase